MLPTHFTPPPLLPRDDVTTTLEHKWTFEGHQLGVVSVAMDPSGQRELDYIHHCDFTIMVVCSSVPVAASSGLDGYIKLWNLEDGKLLKSIDGGPGQSSVISDVLCTLSFYQSSIS